MPDFKTPPRIISALPDSEIEKMVREGKLHSISLRLPCKCNLNCEYCYNRKNGQWKSNWDTDKLTYSEIIGLLDQAFALGAKDVWIVGDGEPFLYHSNNGKDFFDLIDYINESKARPIIFTNNTLINEAYAKKLYDRNVVIIAKMNTLDETSQDRLCGKPWASKKLKNGLDNLIAAGFTEDDPSRLAVATIITKENYGEIPKMWRQFRKENIIPYFQICVPPKNENDRKVFFRDKEVNPVAMRRLFDELVKIDQKEFGYTWDPVNTYPIAGLGCMVVRTSCGITPRGDVQLCAYVENPLGNVREKSLQDILLSTQVLKIKTFRYNQEGSLHFGCRDLTYNITGDRFAVDPFWKDFK